MGNTQLTELQYRNHWRQPDRPAGYPPYIGFLGRDMQRYIGQRILQTIVTVLFVATIVFFLVRIQGNPADFLLPMEATQADFERLEARLGLDQPLYVQYAKFIGNAARGDLGESISQPGRSAASLVIHRLPATFMLAGVAFFVAMLLALPIGVLSSVRKGTAFDQVGKGIAVLGQAVPPFWLGVVLIWIFAVNLGWVRTSGFESPRDLILPAITLGWYHVAVIMRLTRSGMLETLDSEYVKLARLKGVPEWRVVWQHAFRNAAIVPLTYFGLTLAALMTGAVVVEIVFSWPGTGRLAVDAVRRRDYPVVQATVMVFAIIFVVANLVVDIVYAYLDPRIRYGKAD